MSINMWLYIIQSYITSTLIPSHIFKYMYNIINAYIFKHIICLYISIHIDIHI